MLWWSEGLLGCLEWLGVIKGQLSTIKGPGCRELHLHIASFEPESSWRKERDLRSSQYYRGDAAISRRNASYSPGNFLHSPPLRVWTCSLHPGAQISRRRWGQFGIQKPLNEPQQQIPSVHDAAVPLLQDGWPEHHDCRRGQPVSAHVWLYHQSHSRGWVNAFFFLLDWILSMLYTESESFTSGCSVLQILSGWCIICFIRPSLFTTWQVSKCLFGFKGFLCFMWQGVYISPQTSLLPGGGSIHILSCSTSHPNVLTFVQGSALAVVMWTADCFLRTFIKMFCLIFRLLPSGGKVGRRVRHVVRLCQWACPAGRASDQTASFLWLQARHCRFISHEEAELCPEQHIVPGGAAFPRQLQHITQQLQVFLEDF